MSILLMTPWPSHPESGSDGGAVRILFTNNSNGKLVNCNCRNDPLGGLAERVSFVTAYRAMYDDVLLVDSGGYLNLSDDKVSGRLVMDMMDRMEYDAIGISDQELYHGMITFFDWSGGYRDVMVSASLHDLSGKPVCEPWRIVNAGSISIGIVGIVSTETFRFFPDEHRDFTVADPDSVLGEVLPAIEDQCDFIVVLSQMGFEEDKRIASRWPSIGLVVGGHSQTLLEEPFTVGDTIIVQAGKGGGRVGEVVLTVDENGQVRPGSHRLIELDNTYKIPPDVLTILEAAGISVH